MPNIDLQNPIVQEVIFIAISLWSLVWKGLALWKAAHKEHSVWFVLILIINTLGILEIIYYFWLSKVDYSKLDAKISDLKLKIWRKK
jgi:methionyl-tRNA synthetase